MAAVALALLVLPACRQDMHDQPKIEALEASPFFDDDQGARTPPQHTVARGALQADDLLYRGRGPGGAPAEGFPFPISAEALSRGRVRYDAFCSPCHDRAGTGRGMVVQRGFKQPPSLHIPRLRQVPPGYHFQIITNGFGQMSGYASQISPRDRWMIVAYIRALQLSQGARQAELAPMDRAALARDGAPTRDPAPGGHAE